MKKPFSTLIVCHLYKWGSERLHQTRPETRNTVLDRLEMISGGGSSPQRATEKNRPRSEQRAAGRSEDQQLLNPGKGYGVRSG